MQPFHPDVIDNTFSTGTGFDGEVKALALQPDGKLIATGAFSTFNGISCNGIARLNADGSLDEGFVGAIGGKALALQPDGRIVVGANGIFRLMPNGSIDPDFNAYLNNIGVQPVNALVVRPDGRIIAGGAFIISDEWGNEVPMSIMQLFQDGSLDNSFVPDLVQYNANVQTLVLRTDGKLLVGMDNESSGGGGTMAFNLAELNEDGSRSQQFNSTIGFSFYNPVHGLALRPNGDVVVGGEFYIFNDDHHMNNGIPRKHLAVIDEMGYLSSSFDPGPSSDGVIRTLAVGPQGQIIAGGDFSNYRYALHSGIVQLNDYGYADALFQSGTGFNGGVRAFALQPDGQLIVGGAFTSYNGTVCGRITRLRTPGPICLPSQLTTTADPVITCGAVNLKLNGTSIIAANEVPGANKYQFRFTNIAGQPAYSRNIAFPTRSFTLTKWFTLPLKAGRTYNVIVRASFDNGATWCDWGPSCTVKVSWTPLIPGAEPRDMETVNSLEPELHLYPNPNNGDQLRIHLNGTDPDITTVALDITDLFGKRVMTSTLAVQDGELNTVLSLRNDLADGLYIVTITAGERVFNERLVITR
ncbi:MAG: T9SS type A sorting domain-containing protein [Flavobacteriales bacterium]|nr:T9SS type A sorting domain-containing protein [Flavobacteriales bacterium]